MAVTLDAAIKQEIQAAGIDIYFWGEVPQGATKYVNFCQISGEQHSDIDVGYPVYQFSCFSKIRSEAQSMMRTIRQTFKQYKGTLRSISILQGVVENEMEVGYESDTKLYHFAIDIKFLHYL